LKGHLEYCSGWHSLLNGANLLWNLHWRHIFGIQWLVQRCSLMFIDEWPYLLLPVVGITLASSKKWRVQGLFLHSFWVSMLAGLSQKRFSQQQIATLRKESDKGHFWARSVVFASQFEESCLICLCLNRFCLRLCEICYILYFSQKTTVK